MVVSFGRSVEVQGEREHSGVFAGTVVAKYARSLASLAQPLSRLAVKRLVDAALQKALVESDLLEHRGDGLGVNVLAAVRAAGDGEFPFIETEAVCRAARDDWYSLKRFGRRAKVRDSFRLAQAGKDLAFAVSGGDVPTVARLDYRAAPDFDERR